VVWLRIALFRRKRREEEVSARLAVTQEEAPQEELRIAGRQEPVFKGKDRGGASFPSRGKKRPPFSHVKKQAESFHFLTKTNKKEGALLRARKKAAWLQVKFPGWMRRPGYHTRLREERPPMINPLRGGEVLKRIACMGERREKSGSR